MSKLCALAPTIALLLAVTLSSPALAQSRRGELRGVWLGSGADRDWPAIVESLQANGFNALFPNFSAGVVAHYPSKALSPADGVSGRDELAEAALAAREHGIELHVWRINWALYGAGAERIAELEAAGRLQRNPDGRLLRDDPNVGVDWLCPSHPANRALEKAAMLELVRSYDIAGVQFDYMRFPSGDSCFCEGCRKRFQRSAAASIAHWPDDARPGGPLADRWQEWRRELLTSLVAEIGDAARAAKPEIRVSLAAWPDLEAGREEHGQDWVAWVREGLLDFVCPMDYTLDGHELFRLVERQAEEVHGAIPLYVGLGAFMMSSPWPLIEQVQLARAGGADGFVAFAYGSGDLKEWLPDLRDTVASADPSPLPHWSPPARFSFAGEATEHPASGRRVIAGARLEIELSVGWQPPAPSAGEAPGAAEAGAMLERMLDVRAPVDRYDSRPSLGAVSGEGERLAGRVVIEAPDGSSLRVLGAFDAEHRYARTLACPAPAGPFRVAVYGSVRRGGSGRDFVVRGPLLVGIEPDAEADVRGEIERYRLAACQTLEAGYLAALAPVTVQVHAEGPGGGQWWLRLADGACETGEGAAAAPNLVLTLAAADLLALARRTVTPQALWESGRLSVTGEAAMLARLMGAVGR